MNDVEKIQAQLEQVKHFGPNFDAVLRAVGALRGSNPDALEHLGGQIFAHTVLIHSLVQKAIENDSEFPRKALAALDTWLGQRAAKGEPLEPIAVKARQTFAELLDVLPVAETAVQPAKTPALTLRRRFLNWLERG